jgi:predicted kinase
MRQFVLQMAGMPGSGKSTLADAIARQTGAVILDKDVIQSAALRAGVEQERTGPTAYEVLFDLATELATHGHSLIVDSAAFFPIIVEKGRRIAEENGADYRVIECVCPSDELHSRLTSRESRASQWNALLDIDMTGRPGAAPLTFSHLVVDTMQPIDAYLHQALRYIDHDQG